MNERNITVGELVAFVLKHRGEHSFIGMEQAEIAHYILEASDYNCLAYSMSDDKLDGVLAGYVKNGKQFWIDNIIIRSPTAFINLASWVRDRYPALSIGGFRHKSGHTFKAVNADKILQTYGRRSTNISRN